MFLDIDPWPDLPLPKGLHRAPWLSRVDVTTTGPSALAPEPAAPIGFPEVRIRRRPRS
jgi:hypothetical protein